MPEPRNLRNDVLPQLLYRHVVGDQWLVRIAGDLYRRQPGMTKPCNFLRNGHSLFVIRSDDLFIALTTIAFPSLSKCFSVEKPHRLFHNGETVGL